MDVASPISYLDERGQRQFTLEETPAIACRKDRMRYYLRQVVGRYMNAECLILSAYFITKDWHPMDATNVLDLIQNAGIKVVWSDDRQFTVVRSQRVISKFPQSVSERTVIYIAPIQPKDAGKPSFRASKLSLFSKNFVEDHNENKPLEKVFSTAEMIQIWQDAFWQDDRFLTIGTLRENYLAWLRKEFFARSSCSDHKEQVKTDAESEHRENTSEDEHET